MIGLLDDSRDEIALTSFVQFEYLIAFCVTKTLEYDLFRRLSRNTAEIVRRIRPLVGHVSVLVEFLPVHHDLAGIRVDGHPRFFSCSRRPLVGRNEGMGKGFEDRVPRNSLLALEHFERIHEVVIHRLSYAFLPGRAPFSQVKIVRVRDTSPYWNFRSVPSMSTTNPRSSADMSAP